MYPKRVTPRCWQILALTLASLTGAPQHPINIGYDSQEDCSNGFIHVSPIG
jgi:hypothetical protein